MCIFFDSGKDAYAYWANDLDVTYSGFMQRMYSSNYPDYAYIGNVLKDPLTVKPSKPQKLYNRPRFTNGQKGKKCFVLGNIFNSIGLASEFTGISKNTIRKKLDAGDYVGYRYIEGFTVIKTKTVRL